jgi:hypothetical protein
MLTLKETLRKKAVKKLVAQMIMACPVCGMPNAACDCGKKAVPMTKGKAADLAIYFTMAKLMGE